MDKITRTPGLHHIAEQIFSNLDRISLQECQKVNIHWWNILIKPWFWFNRMKTNGKLSLEHQKEWMTFCEKLSKTNFTKDMTLPLNCIYGELDNSMTLYEAYWFDHDDSSVSTEIVRIMAPFIDNPNAIASGECKNCRKNHVE